MDAPFDDRSPGPSRLHLAPQDGPAFVNQIKAHVGGSVLAPMLPGAVQGQFNGAPRDVRFRDAAVPGQEFDRMAVAVAGRKIHLAVNAGGVGAQRFLDPAQGFHKLLPIHGAQRTKAGNAMADRHLISGLILTVLMDKLFDGQALFNQVLFEPCARQMQHRTLTR